jgi:hypothetical protein
VEELSFKPFPCCRGNRHQPFGLTAHGGGHLPWCGALPDRPESPDLRFPSFKSKVTELGEYIARELESHIFKEDNILYQIALQVLTPEDWEKVKKECDKIGYCCFTPEDQKEGGKSTPDSTANQSERSEPTARDKLAEERLKELKRRQPSKGAREELGKTAHTGKELGVHLLFTLISTVPIFLAVYFGFQSSSL